MLSCPVCGEEIPDGSIQCRSCDHVIDAIESEESPLSEFLNNFADTPYRDIVRDYVRRFSADVLVQVSTERFETLAADIDQPHLDLPQLTAFLKSLERESLGNKRIFWATATTRHALVEILQIADRTFGFDGRISTLEDALSSENQRLGSEFVLIATAFFAYAASSRRSNRKLMGIKIGLFG